MDNDNSVAERRRYNRIEYGLPVRYRNLRKAGDAPAAALTKNISEGGTCFNSSEFISLACRLVVEINLPNAQKPIKAISKIAWIRKLPSSDTYQLGNYFLEITREDRELIAKFVNNAVNSSIARI